MVSFQLPKKVAAIKDVLVIDEAHSVNTLELLRVLFSASERAWIESIQPRMDKVRHEKISKDSMKLGTDFFTEADTESEETIKKAITEKFGTEAFRIFGEEKNAYTGNLESNLTVRIDPIDGTSNFKFGRPNWSIMVGVYTGRNKEEHQALSVTYYPEYFNEIVYFIDGVGVFIANLTTGKTVEVTHLDNQDSFNDILIVVHKHTDLSQRGNIDGIIKKFEEKGTRVKTTSPTEAKEALQTGGKRAFLIDGDFNQVDFIDFSALVYLGYEIYDWNGVAYNIDDPNLNNKKFVLVPPGKIKDEILTVVTS